MHHHIQRSVIVFLLVVSVAIGGVLLFFSEQLPLLYTRLISGQEHEEETEDMELPPISIKVKYLGEEVSNVATSEKVRVFWEAEGYETCVPVSGPGFETNNVVVGNDLSEPIEVDTTFTIKCLKETDAREAEVSISVKDTYVCKDNVVIFPGGEKVNAHCDDVQILTDLLKDNEVALSSELLRTVVTSFTDDYHIAGLEFKGESIKLTTIDDIQYMEHLDTLSCIDQDFESFNYVLPVSLQELTLAKNKELFEFRPQNLQDTSLQTLMILNHSELTVFDVDFPETLQKFALWNSNIEFLNLDNLGETRLKTLDIQYNKKLQTLILSELPESIRQISASNNAIKTVQADIPESLIKLELQSNALSVFLVPLPDTIKFLNLSRNNIATFTEEVIELSGDSAKTITLCPQNTDGNCLCSPSMCTE